ncbi:hypothetical protein CDD83_3239 [Cordyceps sp. RAO-2017]|nr:hypothetical protein CDD83_3239 [Cordyceps sp. RAO-2017]
MERNTASSVAVHVGSDAGCNGHMPPSNPAAAGQSAAAIHGWLETAVPKYLDSCLPGAPARTDGEQSSGAAHRY